MKKQAGPDSALLSSEKDLEAFINHFDPSVVGECLGAGVCFVLLYYSVVDVLILIGHQDGVHVMVCMLTFLL